MIQITNSNDQLFMKIMNLTFEKQQHLIMYIKNRQISAKIKSFSSYQILCLTEKFVLRNRLLFIY